MDYKNIDFKKNAARFRSLALGASLALLSAGAYAHQIWFEPASGNTFKLYYGEYDKNMLEVTPGGMDRFRALKGKLVTKDGEKPLDMTLHRDFFDIAQKAGKDDTLIAVDQKYPIFKLHDEGTVVDTYWTVATRWVGDLRPRTPELDLDIVPTGVVDGNRVQFQVFYQKEPLTNKPVTMSAASGWDYLGTTDGEGKVSFPLPWKGIYVVGVEFRDHTSGERVNTENVTEKYAIKSFSSTLAFNQPNGAAPMPRPPSTLPASEIARLNKK
ncbi:nickel uptake transporter family protein [Burkholderia ubonensis]|uniref:Nickel uptake transporter family protein n=2 Tax=Burkholderia ubonensis TaxID=101571 RepID=A0AB73G1N9_9BURK|nr:DUF4198 domain-containing protein [Burkholderia ubonensis]KVC69001.1 nickel uptake transporter family protein [Burkholderia ubonensis]KVC71838.1 nickel uptake transporter family protein [Burkholderia ubonensis]KVD17486.1 nickel uptake transporter family protein [Burkholderia ubonensis]KVG70754.1 nickel uptake transporter family protein [Burkholderia ubonensis]KVH19470.1 nickel uptake transporter family protein [Burkholderia ubonensis]